MSYDNPEPEVVKYRVSQAYREALLHTYNLALKKGKSLSSNEAIGDLCTALRRELVKRHVTDKQNPWVRYLKDVRFWRSIVELIPSLEMCIKDEHYQWLIEMTKETQKDLKTPSKNIPKDDLDYTLEILESSLMAAQNVRDKTFRLLTESDIAVMELTKIAETLVDE